MVSDKKNKATAYPKIVASEGQSTVKSLDAFNAEVAMTSAMMAIDRYKNHISPYNTRSA